MELIKLPTIWKSDSEFENLGIDVEVEGELGSIYINPSLIQAVNDSTNANECTIRMSNENWVIKLPLKKVLEILQNIK